MGLCLYRKNVERRIMLNPCLLRRHIKKSAEHMKQAEPASILAVPFVPCSKNEDGTEIAASILDVPCVPSVPSKNICPHRKNVRGRIIPTPGLLCRHIKKLAEHMEQVEQPHKYRAFLFHVPKNEYGTHGTEHETLPLFLRKTCQK